MRFRQHDLLRGHRVGLLTLLTSDPVLTHLLQQKAARFVSQKLRRRFFVQGVQDVVGQNEEASEFAADVICKFGAFVASRSLVALPARLLSSIQSVAVMSQKSNTSNVLECPKKERLGFISEPEVFAESLFEKCLGASSLVDQDV